MNEATRGRETWIVTAYDQDKRLVWSGVWPSSQMHERKVTALHQKNALSVDTSRVYKSNLEGGDLGWNIQQ